MRPGERRLDEDARVVGDFLLRLLEAPRRTHLPALDLLLQGLLAFRQRVLDLPHRRHDALLEDAPDGELEEPEGEKPEERAPPDSRVRGVAHAPADQRAQYKTNRKCKHFLLLSLVPALSGGRTAVP